jgi:hypothetical protein
MICSICGNNYDDGVAFCPLCGAANNSVAAPVAEATPVDEPTVGGFDSIPPVIPQPVEAPVAPVETAIPEALMVAPVETAIPVAPQPEFAPVAPIAQPAATVATPKKKLNKPIIIGAVAALLVAAIVAVVLLITIV